MGDGFDVTLGESVGDNAGKSVAIGVLATGVDSGGWAVGVDVGVLVGSVGAGVAVWSVVGAAGEGTGGSWSPGSCDADCNAARSCGWPVVARLVSAVYTAQTSAINTTMMIH